MAIRREREQVILDGPPTQRRALEIVALVQFKNGDTTPSILNSTRAICGTSVVTITNFDDPSDNQELKLLGHGNTTIKNNTFIQTNTGVDKVLVTGKVYTFTRFSGKWHENE